MTNVKKFCIKTSEITKKILINTKKCAVDTGNKLINCLTPERDYSYLSEEESNAMRRLDREETIDTICWWSFYFIYYLALIVYCIKQAKDIDVIPTDE